MSWVYLAHTVTCSYRWFWISIFRISFLNLCVATRGDFLATPSLQDCWGIDRSFLKILNGCWNIQSLLHKKSTCLCLTQCNLVTSSDFIKVSISPTSSIDQYYILYVQMKKADAKNCTEKQSTCCSNLRTGIPVCCYVRQHVTRRTVSRNLKQ